MGLIIQSGTLIALITIPAAVTMAIEPNPCKSVRKFNFFSFGIKFRVFRFCGLFSCWISSNKHTSWHSNVSKIPYLKHIFVYFKYLV